jgi:hypothetical protein
MDVVQALRRAHQVRLGDRHEIGIGTQPAERPHDAIAHAKARCAGAERLDDTREFDAQHGGQSKREGIPDVAFTKCPIDAVHAGGTNADQNLALARLRASQYRRPPRRQRRHRRGSGQRVGWWSSRFAHIEVAMTRR